MTREELFNKIVPDGNMSGKRATQKFLENNGYWEDVLSLTNEFDVDVKTRLGILKYGDIGRCGVCGCYTKYIDGKFKKYCSEHSRTDMKGKPAHNRKETDEARIIECYKNGMSAMQIAQQEWCNVSHATVQHILKRNGIETRSVSSAIKASYKLSPWHIPQPRKIKWDNELLIKEYKLGKSIKQISIEHNCHEWTTFCQLKRLGLTKPRPQTTEPERIVQGILDKHNLEYIVHDRTQIKPKELDIFIPEHKLAIEVNGLYWHSTSVPKVDTRHIDKFTQCREASIKLLQFTDHMINNRVELIESMILSKLGKLPNKIMARKCRIVEVKNSDANKLLEQWHYQGRTTNAAKCIGLMFDNKIVAVLAYTLKGTECRIERFACELFTNVVGGYSKLEKEITRRYKVTQFTTFSLGLISDGRLYKNNGYITDGYATRPEFYVTDGETLYNRQRFMKSKMPKLFGDDFDPSKTEWENICDNGLMLFFGAGITKWIKKNEY